MLLLYILLLSVQGKLTLPPLRRALTFRSAADGPCPDTPLLRPLPASALSDVLAKWADLWELKDGLFPVRAQRNSANSNQTAVLAEMVTGKVAFHTANGLMNAQQIEKDVEILGGVQSVVCVQEFAPRGYEFQMEDPVGVKFIAARSYDIVAPNTGGAYILTGVV